MRQATEINVHLNPTGGADSQHAVLGGPYIGKDSQSTGFRVERERTPECDPDRHRAQEQAERLVIEISIQLREAKNSLEDNTEFFKNPISQIKDKADNHNFVKGLNKELNSVIRAIDQTNSSIKKAKHSMKLLKNF